MLVGAGMFVLCSCTSQGSQQKEVVTDSVKPCGRNYYESP